MASTCSGCDKTSSSHSCIKQKKRKKASKEKEAEEEEEEQEEQEEEEQQQEASKDARKRRKLDTTAEIKAALEWLTCDDLREIKRGEGATQHSVKEITKHLLDDPDLDLTMVRIGAVRCKKTPLTTDQLRQQWREDRIQTILLDPNNADTRQTFLQVVKRIRNQQKARQQASASAAEKKREEKKQLAAIERAENQAQRSRLHHLLKKNQTYLLAICPIVGCMCYFLAFFFFYSFISVL